MTTNPKPTPVRPSPERVAQLQALADLHDRWERANLRAATLEPSRGDHNLHYLDADASPEVEAEFAERARRIMGLASTWRRPDRVTTASDFPDAPAVAPVVDLATQRRKRGAA